MGLDLVAWMEEHTDPSFLDPYASDAPLAPRRLEPSAFKYGAHRIDRIARHLAGLCAGWAHRGFALENLVGVAYGCPCHAKVMPRDEIARRLAPGLLLDALSSTRAQRGRLTVVATVGSGYGSAPAYTTHWIAIPDIDVPDTRGVLGKLPSEQRRNELVVRLEELKPRLRPWIAKELFDHHTLDALYLETFWLEYGRQIGEGGNIGIHRKKDAPAHTRPLLDAAQFEVVPNKLLCLVPREYTWEDDAVVWLDPAQVGMPANAKPCTDVRGALHP